MDNFPDKIRELWVRLTVRQRIQIGAAALMTVGLVWGLSNYATRIRYDVLYSGLQNDDASAVMASLREKQIPYRLSAGGSTIEVPVGQVDEARLELAGEGLPPGGGVGFEIFDKPNFGLSDFVQNVNYHRALERELGRTIQSLASVDTARVHLAMPAESVFADEKTEPSASVLVNLRGSLSDDRVNAIVNLVASGVEGLDPQNVSVVDNQGRMLTDGSEDERMMSASQVEAKRAMENNIEGRLVSILEPLVGTGRVRARATVELNLTRIERMEETYDPNVAVVRSEAKSKSSQSAGGPGGVPGTTANLPTGSPVAARSAGSKDESQTTETKFEINKTVSNIAEPVGTLARQSVAVVVDHTRVEETGENGEVTMVPAPRSEEEMQKITDLVSAAIGMDVARGDVLIVENAPFDDTAFPSTEEPGGLDWGFILTIARFASLPLAVILLALLVIRPGISAVRSLQKAPSDEDQMLPTVAALQARLQSGGEGALPGFIEGATPLRRKLIEAAGEDPEAAAVVVKGWLEGAANRD